MCTPAAQNNRESKELTDQISTGVTKLQTWQLTDQITTGVTKRQMSQLTDQITTGVRKRQKSQSTGQISTGVRKRQTSQFMFVHRLRAIAPLFHCRPESPVFEMRFI